MFIKLQSPCLSLKLTWKFFTNLSIRENKFPQNIWYCLITKIYSVKVLWTHSQKQDSNTFLLEIFFDDILIDILFTFFLSDVITTYLHTRLKLDLTFIIIFFGVEISDIPSNFLKFRRTLIFNRTYLITNKFYNNEYISW